MRTLFRTVIGLCVGYGAYLAILAVNVALDFARYGRVDGERSFWSLYYPFVSLYFLIPSTWTLAPMEERILSPIGGLLLVGGVWLANRFVLRGSSPANAASGGGKRRTG